MDFALNEEQRMFQKMFRDFTQGEVSPRAEATDHEEKPPVELLQKAAMQGFLGATFPEQYAGAEMDTLAYCMLLEELAKGCLSTALTINCHVGLAGLTILRDGTDEQKDRYLEAMAMGEKIGAFALTEAAAGSDPASMATTARRNGDGYLLNGSKSWVSNGGIADVFVVFAKTDPKATSAFLVERDTPGFKVGYREKTLGLRGVACNTLYFDDCQVPADNLLGGEEGQGLKSALKTLDFSRLAVAAMCLGGAQRAVDEAVQFSLDHIQFGGPIAEKQAIQNYVADAAAEIEALRYLVYHAAWLVDQGQSYTKEAAMAKLIGATSASRITDNMLQVHGGYGYMKEYAIERMYRDFRALEIVEGTNEIQRVVIAAQVYRDKGVKVKP